MPSLEGPRILIVEDDSNVALKYKRVLERIGSSQIVRDSTQVFEQINNLKPQVILLDLVLDDDTVYESWMAGIQILEKLRNEHSSWQDIPVIVLSGRKETKDQCQNLGADFLPKPVANDELRKTVKQKIYGNSILFLAADPTDLSRLRLGKEFQEIQNCLIRAEFREHFQLVLPQLSSQPAVISEALLKFRPKIVHFSGHGTLNGALCLEMPNGKTHLVGPDTLADLFSLVADHVTCIVLNACYSEMQANAIAEHIDYVIGMNEAIDDKAAIAFSIGFYQALGAGKDIEKAFAFGCVQIGLQGFPGHLVPVLIKKEK